MGRYNLPFVLCTNSTKRTLVKDLHFIGPKLSHLIKLTVTEWATQGQRGEPGDWLVPNSCDTEIHLSLGSRQTIISSWCKNQKKKIKKSQPQRQQQQQTCTPLNNIIAVKKISSKWQTSPQSGNNICRSTLDFNDGYETANEQVKTFRCEIRNEHISLCWQMSLNCYLWQMGLHIREQKLSSQRPVWCNVTMTLLQCTLRKILKSLSWQTPKDCLSGVALIDQFI